jgi:hypothetical protein
MILAISHGYTSWSKSLKHYKHLETFVPKWNVNLFPLSCWLYVMITRENVLGGFFTFCSKVGITHELTQAYIPSHNGVLEQKNCMFLEKAHLRVVDAQTPRFLWVHAVNIANYITNWSPTRANNGMTLY